MQHKGGTIQQVDEITTTTTDEKGSVVVKKEIKTIAVQQPENPRDGATVQTPQTKSSIGGSHVRDFAGENMTNITTWAGIAFIAIGTLIAIFAGYIPFLSAVDGIWIACVGVGIIFIPIFLDKYAIYFIILGVVSLAAWMIFKQSKIAYFKKATGPIAQAKLLADGDARAAGALAFVFSGNKDEARRIARSFE